MILAHSSHSVIAAPFGAPSKRERLTSEMARCLFLDDAFHNADDAALSLRCGGFGTFDIMVLIDDARQAAFQQVVEIVAEAMSQS